MLFNFRINGDDSNICFNLTTDYRFYRWVGCESEKYDVEYSVKLRDMQIHDLEMEVSDMRGKFIIPKLKKVHTFKLMDES